MFLAVRFCLFYPKDRGTFCISGCKGTKFLRDSQIVLVFLTCKRAFCYFCIANVVACFASMITYVQTLGEREQWVSDMKKANRVTLFDLFRRFIALVPKKQLTLEA
jgi:hypothetical protein